jgi:hypothetical protein
MWQARMLPSEKAERVRIANIKRRALHPNRSELYGRVVQYCVKRKLSKKAASRIYNLVYDLQNDVDERDLRSVPVKDRVPRSLEPEMTFSEYYWNVEYFGDIKMLLPQGITEPQTATDHKQQPQTA